jgi:C_GCAxxG_C_C family probable redox protein
MRAIGPFGGGLGRGEVCGAVSGAIAVFGLVFSRGKEEERENLRMWSHIQRFIDRFEREIGRGSIYCRDIAGADWRDLEAVKAFYRSEKLLDCRRLTGETARLLGEFLEEFERGK